MNKKESQFVDKVWQHYAQAGRHQLPWRQTHDSYRILVSELMLQQTQVERVIPKYETFMQRWPTVQKLAAAQQSDVVIAWQGLGYNRRAKFLHQCAQVVVLEYGGVFPATRKELEALPGVGPYTAGAILAFAHNAPVVLIETNVRRVYLHHFFPTQESVSDRDIYPYLETTLPPKRAREWYSAVMDYGAHLKKIVRNPNQRSKHYSKQSVFKGSDREIRGAILKALIDVNLSIPKLKQELSTFKGERIESQLKALQKESLVQQIGNRYSL